MIAQDNIDYGFQDLAFVTYSRAYNCISCLGYIFVFVMCQFEK